MTNQEFAPTVDEIALIKALRFLDGKPFIGWNWLTNRPELETELLTLTSHLNAQYPQKMRTLGTLIDAINAVPAECVDYDIIHANPYESEIEAVMAPNWLVSSKCRQGTCHVELGFALTDDFAVPVKNRGFSNANGVKRFIVQTRTNKDNAAKRDVLASILDFTRQRFEATEEAYQKHMLLFTIIERIRDNPEAPLMGVHVLPQFR